MSKSAITAFVAFLPLLGACAFAISGCDSGSGTVDDDTTKCEFGGEEYSSVQVKCLAPSPACKNELSCHDGYWARATDCGPSVQCGYDGRSYWELEVFPAADGCNECTCEQDAGIPQNDMGSVRCTEVACEPRPLPTCTWAGKVYQEGEIVEIQETETCGYEKRCRNGDWSFNDCC